jgi:transposase InsO family protein
MPWPVKDLLSVRLEFVTLASQPDANVRQLCRRFGISPTAGYKWLNRYEREGPVGLGNHSRRPHESPTRTEPELEGRIKALRQEHPAWGARKLRRRLQDLGQTGLPATSTITSILHRHGLIGAAQSRAAEPYQRFARPAPNQLWQVDFKGWFALSQGRCHSLCALDDCSRYNVLLAACADQQSATVQARLTETFRVHGLPDQMLWDNGSPWGSGGGEETTGLEVWLMRLGVRSTHGRPYHPQTQGKEERFHRTLQAEVLAQGGWQDCAQVQRAFDHWRPIYNTERPHHALNMETPVRHYRPSQRSFPESLPPVEYALGVQVRQVDQDGCFSFHGQPWKAGRAFAGEPVGLRPTTTDGVWEVLFQTQIFKELDLRHKQIQPVPKTDA